MLKKKQLCHDEVKRNKSLKAIIEWITKGGPGGNSRIHFYSLFSGSQIVKLLSHTVFSSRHFTYPYLSLVQNTL